MVKTRAQLTEKVAAFIKENHPYDEPVCPFLLFMQSLRWLCLPDVVSCPCLLLHLSLVIRPVLGLCFCHSMRLTAAVMDRSSSAPMLHLGCPDT